MKKLILLPVLLLSLLALGQPRWKQTLRYQMEVKLDDPMHALDAVMKLQYINHSPDTLHFIWFHLWPNAYRNDKTRYSDQLLENGKTSFYFSEKESRGYINRLEFQVDGDLAGTQDNPEYIDVAKLMLPKALLPGDSIMVSASFHVKLPDNFSGTGHTGNNYEISNWYPEPAVYDQKGWHPMPFLEQGGAYHEAADYQVKIELPAAYTLAAGSTPDSVTSVNSSGNKIYRLTMKNANAFAWVADKRLKMKKDSVQLHSGKWIGVSLYYFARDSSRMFRLQDSVKKFIHQLSQLLTEYPHANLNIVETLHPQEQSYAGMILLDEPGLKSDPQSGLLKALAGQWFQAITLSDQRQYPWMSKGFMEYYEGRLQAPDSRDYHRRTTLKNDRLWLRVAEKEKTVQPINTPATDLSQENYVLVAGTKSSLWLKSLEDSLGIGNFDRSMHAYFEAWKFGHPAPDDFKTALEKASGRNLENAFEKINSVQNLFLPVEKKILKPAWQGYSENENKYNYINIEPALGYNYYNRLMAGLLINNYNLPENNFQFLFIPLYSWFSRSLEGLGRISYSWHPKNNFRKITIGINGSRFSSNRAKDSTGVSLFEGFSKLVPYLRFDFKKKSARSELEKWMDFKSYLIYEKQFSDYAVSTKDSLIHPNSSSGSFRYLNQFSMNIRDERVLYPFNARFELQQTNSFYRINLTGNYFYNYPSGGGMRVRFFAAKFGVWNSRNKQDLSRYQPKLLGITGDEDYTYDQYFIGRSASYAVENSSVSNGGLPAQQISIRDGGLKLRVDAYDFVQGRSADWVSALNFSSSLPAKLFPVPVPIRVFFDVGTYSEAWKPNPQTSKFLYTGGIQLSLFKNVLNIYAPLIYSSDFRDLIKTEGFARRITFSIDIQNLDHKNWASIIHHGFRN